MTQSVLDRHAWPRVRIQGASRCPDCFFQLRFELCHLGIVLIKRLGRCSARAENLNLQIGIAGGRHQLLAKAGIGSAQTDVQLIHCHCKLLDFGAQGNIGTHLDLQTLDVRFDAGATFRRVWQFCLGRRGKAAQLLRLTGFGTKRLR